MDYIDYSCSFCVSHSLFIHNLVPCITFFIIASVHWLFIMGSSELLMRRLQLHFQLCSNIFNATRSRVVICYLWIFFYVFCRWVNRARRPIRTSWTSKAWSARSSCLPGQHSSVLVINYNNKNTWICSVRWCISCFAARPQRETSGWRPSPRP